MRLPTQKVSSSRDIRAAAFRIIHWQGVVGHSTRTLCEPDDQRGGFSDANFCWVSQVDGPVNGIGGAWREFLAFGVVNEQAGNPFHEVRDVAKAAGLSPASIDGEVLALQAWTMKLEMTRPS